MQLAVVVTVLVAIGVAVFALQNNAPIVVTLFVWSVESSLALVLLVTFGLGFLTSMALSIPTSIRRRQQIADGERRIQELKSQRAAVERPPPASRNVS